MGPSLWQLLIVLLIVLLLFGTKKLRNIGGDLGGAIKSFRSAVKEGGQPAEEEEEEKEKSGEGSAKLAQEDETVIEGEVSEKERKKA